MKRGNQRALEVFNEFFDKGITVEVVPKKSFLMMHFMYKEYGKEGRVVLKLELRPEQRGVLHQANIDVLVDKQEIYRLRSHCEKYIKLFEKHDLEVGVCKKGSSNY